MHATSIVERLRAETLPDHKATEAHPLHRSLALGSLPRELFVRHLSQLLHVHRALDAALTRLSSSCPPIATVLRTEHLQAPYLEEDLAFLGFDHASDRPLPATAALVAEIERTAAADPVSLLGFHYVLEGSNNGSKFLCRVVQRAYGLQPGAGTRYMDPYGERQRDVWSRFKTDMDSVGFAAGEADRIVDAARVMFRALSSIGDELVAAHPLAAGAAAAAG